MALNKYARVAIGLAVFGIAYGASHFGVQSLLGVFDNKVNITEVAVGDCLKDLGTASTIQDATHVDCSQTHEAEVYALKTIKNASPTVPGDVDLAAEEFCRANYEAFVGVSYEVSKLEIITTYPLADSWKAGDRGITCLVGKPNYGTTKGSLKNSKQ